MRASAESTDSWAEVSSSPDASSCISHAPCTAGYSIVRCWSAPCWPAQKGQRALAARVALLRPTALQKTALANSKIQSSTGSSGWHRIRASTRSVLMPKYSMVAAPKYCPSGKLLFTTSGKLLKT